MNGWKLVPIDLTEEMIEAFAKAETRPCTMWEDMLAAAPTPPAAVEAVQWVATVTLTGRQLADALELVAPDAITVDWAHEQMDSEVSIGTVQKVMDDDGQASGPNLCAWLTEYPEEGCIPLDIEQAAPVIADTASAIAPADPVKGVATWQPIDTARPSLGRTLLLGFYNTYGKWRTVRGRWISQVEIDDEWDDPEDVTAGWYEIPSENDDEGTNWRITPTHWMPLPGAPVSADTPADEGTTS